MTITAAAAFCLYVFGVAMAVGLFMVVAWSAFFAYVVFKGGK